MHLTSIVKFARQLSSRGYIYSFVTGIRAIKILFHLDNHLKLVQLMHTNTDLTKLISSHPRLIYRYLGDYLAIRFSTGHKLTMLQNHYMFLLKSTHKDFFKKIQEKTFIWQEKHNNDQYSISLAFPFGRDCEGDLSLVFEFNSISIYILSFTFIPGEVMNFFLTRQFS